MFKIQKLIFVFCFVSLNAQIHEIGGFIGGSNYIGDLGSTTYINPERLVMGMLYKWNRNPRLAYRFSLNGAFYQGNDLYSNEPARNQRRFNFSNSMIETSAGLEFNFFDFNLHEGIPKFTPYVHTGLNYVRIRELYLDSNIVLLKKRMGTIAIPMTLGVKANILQHFVLAAEIGARYTFTDNLDGSSPKDNKGPRFGNINNNDWYVFTGMTLTYTFGNKPCYCVE